MASMLKSVAKSVLNSMQEVEFMLSGTTPGLSSESTNSGKRENTQVLMIQSLLCSIRTYNYARWNSALALQWIFNIPVQTSVESKPKLHFCTWWYPIQMQTYLGPKESVLTIEVS